MLASDLKRKMNYRWMLSPWRFAVFSPGIGSVLFVFTTPLFPHFVNTPSALIFLPLPVYIFGLLPAFAAGLIYGMLALGVEACTRKPLSSTLGCLLGGIAGPAASIALIKLMGSDPLSLQVPLLVVHGVVVVSCIITGFILSRKERALLRIESMADTESRHLPAQVVPASKSTHLQR